MKHFFAKCVGLSQADLSSMLTADLLSEVTQAVEASPMIPRKYREENVIRACAGPVKTWSNSRVDHLVKYQVILSMIRHGLQIKTIKAMTVSGFESLDLVTRAATQVVRFGQLVRYTDQYESIRPATIEDLNTHLIILETY